MRLAVILTLSLLLAASPAHDWTRSVSRTPAGAYVQGNPAARVKIVEYASYTCPHCAAFSTESAATLEAVWIRDGSTSLELRNLIRDSADLAAAVVARCTGPAGFFPTSRTIFAQQPQWLERAFTYQQTNAARMTLYPLLPRLRAIADGSGLSDIGRAAGLTAARLDACFADRAEVDRIVATANGATGITATPTFVVAGQHLDAFTWDKVEPLLRARGAR